MKKPDQQLIAVSSLFNRESTFNIPVYQRRYTWSTSEAEVFLDDYLDFIKTYDPEDMISSDQIHFLGAIYLAKMEKNGSVIYDIVDGQQRLTSLVLLMNSIKRTILHITKTEKDNMNVNDIIRLRKHIDKIDNFLYSNPENLDTDNTKWSYAQDIHQLKLHVLKADQKNFFDSINSYKLNKKFNYAKTISTFQDKLLETYFNEKAPYYKDPIKWFKKIISPIFNKIELLKVEIKDIEDAYSTFERLNDRGVKLSVFDLLNIKILKTLMNDDKLQKDYSIFRDRIEKKCRELKLKPVKVMLQHHITKYGKISEKDIPLKYSEIFKTYDDVKNEFEEILNILEEYEKLFQKWTGENSSVERYKILNTPYFRYSIAYLKNQNINSETLDKFINDAISVSWNANINSTSLGAKYNPYLNKYISNAINSAENIIPNNQKIANQYSRDLLEKTISNQNLIKYALFIEDMKNGTYTPEEVFNAEINFIEDSQNRIEEIYSIKIQNKEIEFDFTDISDEENIKAVKLNFN